MRRLLRFFLIGLAALLVAGLLYSLVVVLQARSRTPEIVQAVLDSGRMELRPEDFPPGWIDALLAVEDPAFHSHNGMDLSTPGAGITTITQGLVKRLYFENFKPGFAKLKQTLIAVFALDALVSKETQLALFVNVVYLGQSGGKPVEGLAQASRAYFGNPFQQLTRDEYLALVAMIIAPATFHVKDQPRSNAVRVERIRLLLDGKYRPTGLMDLYYGGLTEQEQHNVAPASYFPPRQTPGG